MRLERREILLYAGFLLAMIPVILTRDFTPGNELRYLSIADEALANHTFFAFTNHGVPYADKPPLYLWLVMLCKAITGSHHMWLLALFSVLPAIGIVMAMDHWAREAMQRNLRPVARMILLTAGLFAGSALTLRMDMLMCLFIVLSLRQFWKMLQEPGNKGARRLFPIYLFLAIFTKGPLGLLIPLCSTAAYLAVTGRIKSFFRYWGLRTWGVMLLFTLLWVGAVYLESGTDYLQNLFVHQTVDRGINSFHHSQPFYYYLVCIWYCLAPWSLFVAGAGVLSLRPKCPRSGLQVFFLTIATTSFILLSVISSKLQIYMLPAIPFMVYAAVMALPYVERKGWVRWALAVPAVIFSAALPGVLVASGNEKLAYLGDLPIVVAALALTGAGLWTLVALYGKRQETGYIHKVAQRMGGGLLMAVFFAGWALPRMNADLGFGKLCEKALEISREQGITDIRTWNISRTDNMDVYLSRDVTIIPKDSLPPTDGEKPYLLLTRSRHLPQFPGRETYNLGKYAIVVCP